MDSPLWVIGTSMTDFGRYPDRDLMDLGSEAALAAMRDGGVTVQDLDVIASGSMLEPQIGLGIQKNIGQTGIPVFNVVNACATGAMAFRTVLMAIGSGQAEMGLAVGVEQLGKRGLLQQKDEQTTPETFTPDGRRGEIMATDGLIGTDLAPAVFALAGMEYAAANGGKFEHFAKVAQKNHSHSTLNPHAMYQKEFSLEQIMQGEMIAYPNTVLMCSPNCDGAAAAVIVSDEKLRSLDPAIQRRAVKIRASAITTDPYVEGNGEAFHDVNTLTRAAADQAYEQAGLGPEDLDLVELHDCFASAELVHYDNLRLCGPGEAVGFLESGAPYRSGRLPVNVSGGLLSKGHPIAATGLANIHEVAAHLRGEAGARQVEGARVGMTHVLGGGWTCAVHVLEKPAA